MEAFLIMIATGAVCCMSFMLGAKVGQTVVKGKPVEMPNINPMEAVQKHREKKAAEEEQNRIDVIMRNIDAYDGTGYNQKDVPVR